MHSNYRGPGTFAIFIVQQVKQRQAATAACRLEKTVEKIQIYTAYFQAAP